MFFPVLRMERSLSHKTQVKCHLPSKFHRKKKIKLFCLSRSHTHFLFFLKVFIVFYYNLFLYLYYPHIVIFFKGLDCVLFILASPALSIAALVHKPLNKYMLS